MAEPIALPRFLQQIGGAGHVFHATGHHDAGVAEGNGLRGQDQGLEAGPTDLVDRRGANRVGDAGSDRGLAGRRLAQSGTEDTAQVDLIDTIWPHLDSRQGLRHNEAAQLGGGHGAEHPAEASHRCSHRADDDRLLCPVHRICSQWLCSR